MATARGDTATNIRRWNNIGARRKSISNSIRYSVVQMMTEGRKTQIVLLDDKRLDILVQPKLLSGELLDLVASHFNLKEKEYFGLSYKDDSGHQHWLQLDRTVLDHEFFKKGGPLILYFAVRFFIESISYLRDSATVELFYYQAKHSLIKGNIECDSSTIFELAAYVMQATFGDFVHVEYAREQLKKLPVIPTSTYQQHPSISYCEDQVLDFYEKLVGQSRGLAVVNYMNVIESLPTYGIHYYEVKDKAGAPWWLGISHKGIAQYDHNDKKVPRKVFPWKQLENLYFRDKKFSIEVHDPKRVSVSRRTFGAGNVNVHAWFTCSSQLTKCIWSMAVSQHQFYLDRKQSKCHLPCVRSMSEIAADLSQSTTSLPSSLSDNMSRSNSSCSVSNTALNMHQSAGSKPMTAEELEAAQKRQKELYESYKDQRHELMVKLRAKYEELKKLCAQEAGITGTVPEEYSLVDGEVSKPAAIGAAYGLARNTVEASSDAEKAILRLEADLEVQKQIANAALKLARDKSADKRIRKSRKSNYQKAHKKLKDCEKKLNKARQNAGKEPVKVTPLEGSDLVSPVNSPAPSRSHLAQKATSTPSSLVSLKGETEEVGSPWTPITPDMLPPVTPNPNQKLPHTPQHTQQHHPVNSRPVENLANTFAQANLNSSHGYSSSASLPGYSPSPQHNPNPSAAHHGGYNHMSTTPGPTPHLAGYHSSSHTNMSSLQSASLAAVPSPVVPPHNYQVNPANCSPNPYQNYTPNAIPSPAQPSQHQTAHAPNSQGYTPNSCYRTSTAYRSQMYPTFSSQTGYQDTYNLYNLNSSVAYQYESGDELEKVDTPTDNRSVYSDEAWSNDQHGSLDSSYRHRNHNSHDLQRHGSVEHTLNNNSTASLSHGSPYSCDTPQQTQVYENGGSDRHNKVYQQQAPPRTPQYEAPPMTFNQSDHLPLSMDTAQKQTMTVTKKNHYVEVSKPFEMSDFYKYSQKFRQQQHTAEATNRLESVLSGRGDPGRSPVPHVVSPHLTPAASAATSPQTPTKHVMVCDSSWTPSPAQQPVYSNPTPAYAHTAAMSHYGYIQQSSSPHNTPQHTPTHEYYGSGSGAIGGGGGGSSSTGSAVAGGAYEQYDHRSSGPTITSYRAPQPQQCEPVTSQTQAKRNLNDTFLPTISLGADFGDEMIAWMDAQDADLHSPSNNPTLV